MSKKDFGPACGAGSLDVGRLGQVFTPDAIVERMLGMRRNQGRVLEPSCGDGAFFKRIPGCAGIEFDARVAPAGARVMDFFDLPETEQFETIIGNPPYVRNQDIDAATKAKLPRGFDGRTNLYVLFMDKCIRHLATGGEMILIVPREFLKATSARPLNERLHAQGTFTDLIDLGDQRIFKGAAPNCVMLRWVKGDLSHRRADGARQVIDDGLLSFVASEDAVRLGDILSVRVGGLTGDDEVFKSESGTLDIVISTTRKTGRTCRVIPDALTLPAAAADHLRRHEARLRSRRIRRFTDKDWWRWGRAVDFPAVPRLYVNAKTRCKTPFFSHACEAWDGSMLALFPRRDGLSAKDLGELAAMLNAVDWNELGFCCDGRLQFGQRSLESARLPASFARFLPGAAAPTQDDFLLAA